MKASLSGKVAWREICGEVLVVDFRRNVMYGLNEPGGLVWRALDQDTELAAVASALGPEQPDAASRAVMAFVEELAGFGLVSDVSGAIPSKTEEQELPFVPPQVVWQEPLSSFGQGACGLRPAQGGPCIAAPSGS